MARTGRQRDWQHWPVARGFTPASTAADTHSDFVDPNISAGDVAAITPGNAAAAALQGAVAGVYVTVTDGQVRLTHGAAAGGEIFHVTVDPVAL